MDLYKALENVQTRQDLVRFIQALRQDFLEGKSKWESPTLDSYLDTLAAVIDGLDARFANQGLHLPDQLSWHLLAEVLLTATTYE